MSFPYPAAFQSTAEKRNAARHEDVLRQTRAARAALQSMVSDLDDLEKILTGEQWAAIAAQGYFRAEIVGRIFSQTHHRLRDYHDAEVIAVARAGGFEDEPKAPLMEAARIAYLRGEIEGGTISVDELNEIEAAFKQIDPAHFNEPAENAMADDQLYEIENENIRRAR